MATPSARYIEEAVKGAAECLLWQASDASEDGGDGFPISDDSPSEYTQRVIEEVPYLTEAVTAFVTDNFTMLAADRISGAQCGHDFILTANHHGTGFWDRGYKNGGKLTDATRGYSFDAQFMLDEDGDVTYLVVENVVLADELDLTSEPGGEN